MATLIEVNSDRRAALYRAGMRNTRMHEVSVPTAANPHGQLVVDVGSA
jgi:hypothetical protein